MPTKMRYLDPRELNDLSDLAARGGIGRGVALTDCVAEAPDQLMYIEGDELILLRDLGDVLLASCEGIIGWAERRHVKFDSLASGSTPPAAISQLPLTEEGLPHTILTSPSPPLGPSPSPQHRSLSPDPDRSEEDQAQDLKPRQRDLKRISGPFELESPQASPALGKEDAGFFGRQQSHFPSKQGLQESTQERNGEQEQTRDSLMSSTSSEAFGGIGGFMIGGAGQELDSERGDRDDLEDEVEALKDERSPATPTIITPHHTSDPDSTRPSLTPADDPGARTENDDEDEDRDFDDDDEEWDIYNDYARESMYGPAKRMSLAIQQRRLSRAAKAASKIPSPLSANQPTSDATGTGGGTSSDAGSARATPDGGRSPRIDEFRLPSAERRLGSPLPSPSPTPSHDEETAELKEEDQTTPRLPNPPSPSTPGQGRFETVEMPQDGNGTGRSVATELRLRILRERELEQGQDSERERNEGHAEEGRKPNLASPTADAAAPGSADALGSRVSHTNSTEPSPGTDDDHSRVEEKRSTEGPYSSEESAIILTPRPPDAVTFTAPSPSSSEQQLSRIPKSSSGGSLLASPLPKSDEPEVKITANGIISAPNLVPRPPNTHSPNLSPHLNQAAWAPGSPSSPHSVAATRQAVDVARSTSGGKRPRGLTLVGRMDTELLGAKGPIPITFLVNGPGMPVMPTLPTTREPIGLGLPTSHGRLSPSISQGHEGRRAPSPLASPVLPDDLEGSNQSSPFPPHPHPVRSATSPLPPSTSTPATPVAGLAKPSPPFSAGRPRARSFSASVAKTLGVGGGGGGGKKDATPLLSIVTSSNAVPPLPSLASPIPQSATSTSTSTKRSFFGSRKTSLAPQTPPPPHSPSGTGLSRASAAGSTVTVNINGAHSTHHPNDSTPSLPPPSARSSSFSFNSKSSKTPRKPSRALPSPVSHKDYAEETVKAEGLDFELIQPRKPSGPGLLSPIGDVPSSPSSDDHGHSLTRKSTMVSQNSASSLRPLPETDEWGFLKDKSPVPEIFQSRSAPGDHRAIEQKWLSIINSPIPPNSQPPKKVKKLVLDAGVPSSLRGKVWAWFMANTLSARTPGLYQELIEHDNGMEDQRIDKDVAGAYPDHSIFSTPNSPGQMDLRSILRAYSNFAPAGYRPEMALIAGALLIHCVAEDSFWLLSGLVNTVLKDYFAKDRTGIRIDAAVFVGLLQAQEPKLAKLFQETGLHPISFVDKWFSQLFIRCLPWPTTLRVIDAVVSEGPRFLLVASLTILSLSKDRLLSLPRESSAILAYLQNLPQDSLLLPENVMKHCERVSFDEREYRRLRASVEKEVMGA